MPAAYSLPSWLETKPDDIANKFVSGVQIGAQLGEARNKLAQQAQQSAVENQITQDKLTASTLEQAQQLKVQQAYNDQQISLKQQQVEAAQQKVQNETLKAARQYQFQQAYQKDFQSGLDMGLPQDEAARGAMFKNLGMFGSAAGVASAMKLNNRGGVPTATVLNDSGGRPHTLAQIPGSLSFTDLDRSGGAGGLDWQTRHDMTRSERLQDNQTRMLERQRDVAQKALDALDEVGAGDSQNKLTKSNYQRAKQRLAGIDQQLEKLMGGSQPTGDEGFSDQVVGATTPPADSPPANAGFKFNSPVRVVNKEATRSAAPAAAAPASPPAIFNPRSGTGSTALTAFPPVTVTPQQTAPTPTPPPAAPQYGDFSLDKFSESKEGTERGQANNVNRLYVPQLTGDALVKLATKLGVLKGLEYDPKDNRFFTYQKGDWGSTDVSRRKLEQQVLEAASDQQYFVRGQK